MFWFNQPAQSQIAAPRTKGRLYGLPDAGKPLRDHPADMLAPEPLKAAMAAVAQIDMRQTIAQESRRNLLKA